MQKNAGEELPPSEGDDKDKTKEIEAPSKDVTRAEIDITDRQPEHEKDEKTDAPDTSHHEENELASSSKDAKQNGVHPIDTENIPTSPTKEHKTPTSTRFRATSNTSPITKDLVAQIASSPTQTHSRNKSSLSTAPFSQFSHQQLAVQEEETVPEHAEEEEWQEMPALATHRVYDDWGKVVAKSYDEVVDEQAYGYGDLGGAGKGYTKVQLDDDAQSQTSFDDNTAYLFPDGYSKNALEEDDEARDILSQMQTTKELLTEGQRIAYVGIVRLMMMKMTEAQDSIERSRSIKKAVDIAAESMRLWSQKMMVRVYSHMDIDSQEQVMVEQLADHGVLPEDLTPALMQNARVKNPKAKESDQAETASNGVMSPTSAVSQSKESLAMTEKNAADTVAPEAQEDEPVADKKAATSIEDSIRPASEDAISPTTIPTESQSKLDSATTPEQTQAQSSASVEDKTHTTDSADQTELKPPSYEETAASSANNSKTSLPTYEQTKGETLHIERPEDLPDTKDIDLDIRWTVLCDLFLLLIADGTYDARSRILLEKVGASLSIEWQEICRFEKRVTDALEMQEQAAETWDQEANLEARRKAAKKTRMIVMGLCTVGGGLVIGLSAGVLAPVIGAGLAAGFTSIGVAGTSSFLGGAGAAALIGTTGAGIGGRIGLNASNRRTGAVKTFEYRPLHNNKRVNLIVTVSGWMAGGVDDVRLPFSTVDPVMGDIYSVLWEPEMLQSTGQTIQILATEALTQTIQQIIGATALSTLMAGLAAPIVLTKLAYLIDNPWTVSLARADAAGLILADSLIERNLGARPITLVGFSLGARLIFAALKEMAKRGALGIVQNVYLFGSPIVTRKDEWLRAKTIVSGRLVNGFAGHDWVLGYLFRATSGGLRSIAGLSKVPVPGVENIDLSEIVPGHMAYRGMMPILLREVGWEVESEEFTEIDDPDPDNHEKRQRELISDIEEARRQLETKEEKKGFFAKFSRKKAAAKKTWETYDEKMITSNIDATKDPEKIVQENANVLFDVEAIRREAFELAKQGEPVENITAHLSIKEIQTTLPPMRISSATLSPPIELRSTSEENIRQTRSHDEPHRAFSIANGISSTNLSATSSARASISRASTDHGPETRSGEASRKNSNAFGGNASHTSLSVRPTLLSQHTAPSMSSTSVAESSVSEKNKETVHENKDKHNHWDADEAEFGQEEEIEMSFE